LDRQSLFAVILGRGTVRMTVEYYETIRETLIWQALKYGKREDSLLGIEKIQCSSKLLMRGPFYARSEVVALRNRNGDTDNVRVFVQSEWAIFNTCTAPLFDALFSLPSSASTASGPSFVFDDIENIPIVRHRKSVVDASRYLLDANHEEDAAPSSKPAGPGNPAEFKSFETDTCSKMGCSCGLSLHITHAVATSSIIFSIGRP
jgi:hypothetical protein